MVGDRTAGRFSDGKQGSLARTRDGVHVERGRTARKPKSRADPDDRASVVAKKRVTIVEPRDAGKVEA